MPYRASPGFFLISGNAILVHKRRHGSSHPAAQPVLNKAVSQRDQIVAAFPIKTIHGLAVSLANGENPFVAVSLRRFTSKDRLSLQALLPNMPERGVDALPFKPQFLFITQMPGIAAAAFSIKRAARLHT